MTTICPEPLPPTVNVLVPPVRVTVPNVSEYVVFTVYDSVPLFMPMGTELGTRLRVSPIVPPLSTSNLPPGLIVMPELLAMVPDTPTSTVPEVIVVAPVYKLGAWKYAVKPVPCQPLTAMLPLPVMLPVRVRFRPVATAVGSTTRTWEVVPLPRAMLPANV